MKRTASQAPNLARKRVSKAKILKNGVIVFISRDYTGLTRKAGSARAGPHGRLDAPWVRCVSRRAIRAALEMCAGGGIGKFGR
jgi:hypothetical protein